MSSNVDAYLKVKRFDNSEDPRTEPLHVQLNSKWDYPTLKKEIEAIFNITENSKKVIKIRNKHSMLIPMSELLKGNKPEDPFFVEVLKIHHHIVPLARSNGHLLQDAYLDAIRQKIRNMESRVQQAELLIPQLQWRRQAHMDETVNTLAARVSFLNRRIDELLPAEWKCKMAETIS